MKTKKNSPDEDNYPLSVRLTVPKFRASVHLRVDMIFIVFFFPFQTN